MTLQELSEKKKIIVQIVWGEQKIEFVSNVIHKAGDCVYIMPYIYRDEPLDLNISMKNGVVCNIFADDIMGNRVSWKNIDLSTEMLGQDKVYCLKTHGFNYVARNDDRRKHERIVIRKKGRVYDSVRAEYVEILIHDISDVGISFYASSNYHPMESQIYVIFDDCIGERTFNVRVNCSIARTHSKVGTVFYGCKIVGENKDFLIYAFATKSKRKHREKEDKNAKVK